MKDSIIEEIHHGRRQWARKFKHDLNAMFEDLRRSEEEAKALAARFVKPRKQKPGLSRIKKSA
jgi:hypothetical protein